MEHDRYIWYYNTFPCCPHLAEPSSPNRVGSQAVNRVVDQRLLIPYSLDHFTFRHNLTWLECPELCAYKYLMGQWTWNVVLPSVESA